MASIMVGEDRVRAEARAREREAAEAARYAAVLKAEEATRQAAVLLNDAVLGEDERRPWWAAASREQRELGLAREAIVKALAGPAKTKPALDRPARSLASLPSEVCTLILRFNPMNVRGEEQRNGIVSSCRHFHRAATASFQDRRQVMFTWRVGDHSLPMPERVELKLIAPLLLPPIVSRSSSAHPPSIFTSQLVTSGPNTTTQPRGCRS